MHNPPERTALIARRPFQFSLGALLAIVTLVSVLLASVVGGGLLGVLATSPVVLAGTAVILGGDVRGLRRACLVLTGCGVPVCLLLAALNYPLIVIADSDLGAGAMARVGDWLLLGVMSAAGMIATLACSVASGLRVRLALVLAFLAFVVAPGFRSPDTPYAARQALVAVVGLLLAAEGLPWLATSKPAASPLRRFVWVLAVPGLLLLADWGGRIWLGLLPSWSDSRASSQVQFQELARENVACREPETTAFGLDQHEDGFGTKADTNARDTRGIGLEPK